MGGKQSTNNNNDDGHHHDGPSTRRTFSTLTPGGGPGSTGGFAVLRTSTAGSTEVAGSNRQRTRSLISVQNGHQPMAIGIPSGSDGPFVTARSTSPDSDLSTPDDSSIGALGHGVFAVHSLPAQLLSFNGIKCPVCNKFVIPDDIECHLVMCLTKPRINYNEDILSEDKDECVICFEELVQGDTIARLPCLCIYHKRCIDSWFEINRSCPEHPAD